MDCGAVLIVDADDGIRARLAALVGTAGYDSMEAATGQEAVAAAKSARPSLALIDLRLPDISGYEVCRQLRDLFGEQVGIVLLSADRTEPMDRAAALLVGSDDYMAKPFDAGELLARVRRLVRRAPSLHVAAPPEEPKAGLTRREAEILKRLADGQSPQEISTTLVISEKTVATHVQRVLRKLGVTSRTQAVAVAYRDGLVGTERVVGAATSNN